MKRRQAVKIVKMLHRGIRLAWSGDTIATAFRTKARRIGWRFERLVYRAKPGWTPVATVAEETLRYANHIAEMTDRASFDVSIRFRQDWR